MAFRHWDDALDRAALLRMMRIRKFEERGTALFKQGEISGAFHASIGQEATIVGACLPLSNNDMMTGTHRSHGHPIGKGADLKPLMAELMGKSAGICGGRGGSMHLADRAVGIIGESAIVGGGIPLATGCGLSAKVRDSGEIALCFFGDGAVNQGTFHESLNMASLWKLPVIYLCENNGYAITTSLERSHAQTDIARRADSYGMPSNHVDGQDVEAVYDAVADAAERARSGEGPTLVEAQTYRFDEHNVGLFIPGEPYRTDAEVAEQIASRDPIALFHQRLLTAGWTVDDLNAVEEEAEWDVEQAIAFGRAAEPPPDDDLWRHMYSDPINYPNRYVSEGMHA